MAEEAKKEEGVKEGVKSEVIEGELTPNEERAHAEGWRPKEDWKGDPDDWKDAKTFLRDGELFKKIEDVKRENKTLKRTVTTLKGHYDKVAETEYARAMADLKAQKKQALVDGDPDKVIEVDEKIADVRANKDKVVQEVVTEPEQHQEFVTWVSQNKWYESNMELRAFADTTGYAYTKAHPGIAPGEVFKYVSDRVAKAYPEMFSNQRKNAPTAVEGGSGPRKSTGSSGSKIVLTEDEERVMKRLVRSGTLTEEKYKADLIKLESQGKR